MTNANITVSESADLLATARALVAERGKQMRPSHVSHPVLESIVAAMNAAGRPELVAHAGACYRDDVAWALCLAWLDAPESTESELRAKALSACGIADLTAEQIRAANPGMR